MRTAFYRAITRLLKEAGCELVRKNNGHDIYRGLTGATVTVPRKLDDRDVVNEIKRRAGLGKAEP